MEFKFVQQKLEILVLSGIPPMHTDSDILTYAEYVKSVKNYRAMQALPEEVRDVNYQDYIPVP